MFIDVHCHVDWYPEKEIPEIIERASEARVRIIINNSLSPMIDKKTLLLAKKYPEVRAALGTYPIDGLLLSNRQLNDQIEFIRNNRDKIIAIGEVGIDLKENDELDSQRETFIKFIRLSIELNVPIIVHSRFAEEEVIDTLEKEGAKKVIMHCFTGGDKLVEKIIKNKWYFSIPTNVTRSKLIQKIALVCPIEQLFCETDTPYLHPYGDRNNEPANVVESYKKIAEIKKMPLQNVEDKIEENFKRLFKI